jgi:hypothetical protein
VSYVWNIPTKAQLACVPRLGSQLEDPDRETKDIMIYLHFFVGACDWWIAEYDGDDVFYGFACLGDPQMAEWGTVSFQELKELTMLVPMIDEQSDDKVEIPVEVDCDLHWTPQRFGDIERVKQILAAQGRG